MIVTPYGMFNEERNVATDAVSMPGFSGPCRLLAVAGVHSRSSDYGNDARISTSCAFLTAIIGNAGAREGQGRTGQASHGASQGGDPGGVHGTFAHKGPRGHYYKELENGYMPVFSLM